MPRFELRTLGALQLQNLAHEPVSAVLAQPKRTALLLYLAVTRGYHRRDALLTLFWPEAGENSARHALSQALYTLKRQLGPEIIVTRGADEVSLSPDALACDVHEFGQAVRDGRWADAFELYRGDFIAGFHVDGAAGFERWASSERDRLRAAAASAGWSLARQQVERRSTAEADRTARRAFQLAPSDEGSAAAFIDQLLAADESVTAARFASVVCDTLSEEFGVGPSPELQALLTRIQKSLSSRPPVRLPEVTQAKASEAPVPPSIPVTAQVLPGRVRRVWQTVLVCTLVLVALLAGSRVLSRRDASGAKRPAASLVVLPFQHVTPLPSEDYFVQGMHASLIGELAQISALRVISHVSAMHYQNTTKPLRTIARELQVDAAIEGVVQRHDQEIQIRVSLIVPAVDRHVWTSTYTYHIRDVMKLHGEIARAIARQLDIPVTSEEERQLARSGSVNPAAFDLWLRGSYHASRRRGQDLLECIEYARRSLALTENNAAAYDLMARCYNLRTFVTPAPPGLMFDSAKAAANRALALDPGMASAHAALAYAQAHHDWDWRAAEASYLRALELNPGLTVAHEDLGWLLAWLGRFDAALRQARIAQQENPVSAQAASRVSMIFYLARRFGEARREAQRIVALDPQFMFGFDRLHWANDGLQLQPDAVAAAERAAELAGSADVRRRGFLAYAYGRAGRREEALNILQELLALESKVYVPPTAIAAAYVGLGERHNALTWLERGYASRDGDMVLLKTFPIWDPLRADARFEKLLRQMHFPR